MQENNIYEALIHDEAYMKRYTELAVGAETLVTGLRDDTELLDGPWNYAVDQYDTALRAKWYEEPLHDEEGRQVPWDFDFESWPTMDLPASWNVVDERLFYYESSVVFTRTFRYENRGETRVLLRFGAVQYGVAVILNRVPVGYHRGGSTPFVVDVTDSITRNNRIVLVVENNRRSDRIPMTNTDWFNYGGVHRSIELLRLPAVAIRDHVVALVPGSGYKEISCRIELTDRAAGGEVVVRIPRLKVEERIPVVDGIAETTLSASPELWSPEAPVLYEVVVEYGTDRVYDRIGFREITRSGNEIRLNGTPLFLRGVSIHEESVRFGRSLLEAEVRENLAIAKRLGCNFVRLAHYPHAEQTARIADEIGMMLWEEIPVYWAIDFGNERTYADAENQLSELIRRDRNRASVVIWSVGNENPDTDERFRFMSSLVRRARSLDPTRLVSAACLVDRVEYRIADRLASELDVIGINEYLGWYDPDFSKLDELFRNSTPDRPVIITEFGAGAPAGRHGTRDEMFTEEFQERVYREQIRVISETPYVQGMSPWILYDFRTPRRMNRFQRGYNRKGLLSEDKAVEKKAFSVLQEFYRSFDTGDGAIAPSRR